MVPADDDIGPYLNRLIEEQQEYIDVARRETALLEHDLNAEGDGERESLLGIEEEITGLHGTMKNLAEHMKRGPMGSAPEIHVHVPPTPASGKRHAISMNPPVLGKVRASGLGLVALVVIAVGALIALAAGWIRT